MGKRRFLQCGLLVFALLLVDLRALPIHAQAVVAAHPPMGWNSWDSYGLTVSEADFRANVAVQAAKLKPFGWNYAVIDEGWFLKNPLDRPTPEKLQFQLDEFGRYIPVPARFPSALQGEANLGFKRMGEWVHAQGLLFGIHIVRGIPRESVHRQLPITGSSFHAQDAADTGDACPWDPTNWGIQDNAAGQAWYDALLAQYADWGVDLLKVDCIADHPYKVSEIRQIRRAIDKTHRPMVLSLSPGPTSVKHADEVASLAQMWRISDDVWDVWKSTEPFPRTVDSQFDTTAAWAQYARPGNWPDADMLPLGELLPRPEIGPGARHTRLTPVEQRTMLSLWAMARSPLVLGANLTLLDAPTLALLTDRDLLKIDQEALSSKEMSRDGALVIWKAELPHGETALALFNRGDTPLQISRTFQDVGYTAGPVRYRQIFGDGGAVKATRLEQTVEPHGSVVLLVRRP